MTKRKMPKVKFRDLDWKLVILLIVLGAFTFLDDLFIPVIGELLDPVEITIDMIAAYLVGKRTLRKAMEREEGEVVPGRVVENDDKTVLDTTKTGGRAR